MTQAEYGLKQWLDKGCQGEMDYMVKHGTRRIRSVELVPGTLRVISVCMNYMPVSGDGWEMIYNGNKASVPLALGRLPQSVACAFACMNMCNGIAESR